MIPMPTAFSTVKSPLRNKLSKKFSSDLDSEGDILKPQVSTVVDVLRCTKVSQITISLMYCFFRDY